MRKNKKDSRFDNIEFIPMREDEISFQERKDQVQTILIAMFLSDRRREIKKANPQSDELSDYGE